MVVERGLAVCGRFLLINWFRYFCFLLFGGGEEAELSPVILREWRKGYLTIC